MKKIAFIVDSAAGIKPGEMENVFVVPTVVTKKENGNVITLKDEIDIKDDELCRLINEGADVGTSQPSPGEIINVVESIYDDYDEIYVFPIHHKISGSINAWRMIAPDYPKLKVIQQYALCSLTRYYINYFFDLAKKEEITEKKVVDYIESTKHKWTGFLIVPNVNQLVKGGRVSSFKSVFVKMLGLKLIISYDWNGLVFMDKSSKYEGCVEIIKNAFEKRINLSKRKIRHVVLLEKNLNKKYDIASLIKLLRKEFNITDDVKTGVFPSIITAHTGVDYAAIIILVD